MGIKSLKEINKTGLCIKSKDLTVEYQNDRCRESCGQQVGNICDKGCILYLKKDHMESAFKNTFKFFRAVDIDGRNFDTVVFESDSKILTLLQNSDDFLKIQINQLQNYHLSPREIEIMQLFLEGKSNSEIVKLLFISKSTLRTHLNNIYKKIPADLKVDIVKCHFGRDK